MIGAMRVAVIDIGSNTARLLVADVDGTLEPVREERTYLGLAADILRHGSVSPPKLDDAATAGLVREHGPQVYRFVRALGREVCYGTLSGRRRAELHERVAAALARLGALGGTRAATVAELAHHTAEAAFKAVGRALRAAVRAEGGGIRSTKGIT